jgi:hypothetical protein
MIMGKKMTRYFVKLVWERFSRGHSRDENAIAAANVEHATGDDYAWRASHAF